MNAEAEASEATMVEIREFVDANGAEVSSEVVRLADEANGMKKGDMGQVDSIMEKLKENLKMGAGQGLEMDDHARFVREIALLSSAREAGGEVINDLNFLDDLEKKEADAALDDGLHVFASASAGWKKGFLGGSGKPKKKVAPAASASDSGVAPVRPSQEQAAERAVTFSAETNDAREEEESEDKPTPSQKPMSRFKQSLGKNHLYNSDSDRSMPDARVSAHESEPAPTSSSGSSSKAIRPGATLIGAIKEIS